MYCIGVWITNQLPHFVEHLTGADKVVEFALICDEDVVVAHHPRRLLYHCSSYIELNDGSSYAELNDGESTEFCACGGRKSLRSSHLADVVESPPVAVGSRGSNTAVAQHEVCEKGRREEEGNGKERRAATGKEDDCSCADVIRSKLSVTIISGLDLDRRISNQPCKNV
jgi:hypothetical protein